MSPILLPDGPPLHRHRDARKQARHLSRYRAEVAAAFEAERRTRLPEPTRPALPTTRFF